MTSKTNVFCEVGALLVKETEIDLNPLPAIGNAVLGVQVDVLVLHRAPGFSTVTSPQDLGHLKTRDFRQHHPQEGGGSMKRSKFKEEQIAFALHQADTGTSVEEVCRKIGSLCKNRGCSTKV